MRVAAHDPALAFEGNSARAAGCAWWRSWIPSTRHGHAFTLAAHSGRLEHSTLESRMMRKYQVRFGGGPTEKACTSRTSPAAYPTMLV